MFQAQVKGMMAVVGVGYCKMAADSLISLHILVLGEHHITHFTSPVSYYHILLSVIGHRRALACPSLTS
jgi:hypothetical protein